MTRVRNCTVNNVIDYAVNVTPESSTSSDERSHWRSLINRSNVIFPTLDYLESNSVRHARRQWLRAVQYLESRGKWVIGKNNQVQKKTTCAPSVSPSVEAIAFVLDDGPLE